MILMEIDKLRKEVESLRRHISKLDEKIEFMGNVTHLYKYYAGCDPIEEKTKVYTKPRFIPCRVTQMRGCKEEGGNLYNVNNDGSVTPWANPPKSVSEALEQGYIIHTIEYMGQEFILKKEIKDKVSADV